MFLDGLLLSNPLLRRTKNTAPIYFFHTTSRTLGQRLSQQRIVFHTRSRTLLYSSIHTIGFSANVFQDNVYFFIHAVGHLYIFTYARSTSVGTAYIFSYTQSDSCIFFIHTVGLITAGPRKVNFPFKILL